MTFKTTMLHLTKEELQRWLDLRFDEEQDQRINEHLESCFDCASLLETLAPDAHPAFLQLRRLDQHALDQETLADDPGDDRTRQSSWGASPQTFPEPTHQSRWTLLRKLADGGIGEVWVARDELLGRHVAVKRLRMETATNETIQQRFLYEARITAQLDHPGIVHILDLVEDGPRSYYAMSLIKGETLQQQLARHHQRRFASGVNQRSELFELLRVWVYVARTIAFAHSQSVLHRDIKSENIIVGQFGEVTVIDWGIAKRLDDRSDRSLWEEEFSGSPVKTTSIAASPMRQTRHGVRLGTPAFMSPEQARGDTAAVDERTDVYALAAMLYEILTGQTPFLADHVEAMMEQVLFGELIEPKKKVSWLSETMNQICVKGLARDPEERYQCAGDFAAAVEEFLTSETLKQQTDQARQKLFDLSTDLMVMFDEAPKILWINAAWKRLLGWHAKDLIGLKPNILVHPEDLPRDKLVFEELKAGTTVTGLQRRIQSSDGTYHWFSWTVTPLKDEGITVAVGRNVDELVRRNDELAQLLEATPEAIVVANLDHTIHRINQQVTQMFGYTEAELIGKQIDILVPSRYHKALRAFFENYLAHVDQQPLMERQNLLGRHKDGNQFSLDLRLSPVVSDGVTRIVSSLRRAEDP